MEARNDVADRIVADPAILGGKPIVRGTRIPVDLVLGQLERGWTIDDVLSGYPHLEREDVLACIHYVRNHA